MEIRRRRRRPWTRVRQRRRLHCAAAAATGFSGPRSGLIDADCRAAAANSGPGSRPRGVAFLDRAEASSLRAEPIPGSTRRISFARRPPVWPLRRRKAVRPRAPRRSGRRASSRPPDCTTTDVGSGGGGTNSGGGTATGGGGGGGGGGAGAATVEAAMTGSPSPPGRTK